MNELLLKIAKLAIKEEFENTILVDRDDVLSQYPILKENCACFVTLDLFGELRGCVGSVIAHRSLIDDLISNAKASAFYDNRFYPLTEDEFKDIEIEVSILTQPKQITYESIEDLKSKIEVGVDGVILNASGFQSTFLPQVWESLPNFEDFFKHLCQKANLNENCLEKKPDIFTYQVDKIRES